MVEEAKKRDHRTVGKRLDLFSIQDVRTRAPVSSYPIYTDTAPVSLYNTTPFHQEACLLAAKDRSEALV